ncbi:MAG: LCP family protein [Anaerolineae bacterium]|jgi:LCP family protein required for cell wall assembly
MKRIETTPSNGSQSNRPSPDRLTQLLIGVALFLVAALVALAVDLLLWPTTDTPVAQAMKFNGSLQATATPQPLSPSTPDQPVEAADMQGLATPPPCLPPDDWGIHVVVEGDSLLSVAERYQTDVDTLMLVNCLNSPTIFAGLQLYVPGGAPATTAIYDESPAPDPGSSEAAVPPEATRMPSPTATPPTAFRIDIPDHFLNILLMGSDRRPNTGHWRTDSLIIVSVDTQSSVVRLLSIPRDLWVYIPGHGYNRVNTADLWGELDRKGSGPEWVKRTIHYNLGIPIHYYVRVDFQGFMRIIDTLGGVTIDVDCPLPDINLSAGIHHMTGREALRYARSRKSTNDFDRGRRQRKVLLALWEQALSLEMLPRLPELWLTMAGTVQTDLPLEQVINLAYLGTRLEPQRIINKAISSRHVQAWMTPQGASVLLPREDRIRALLEELYAPVNVAALDTADRVRVSVYNGSSRPQAEELAAAALRWEGFKIAATGPADRRDYVQTQISTSIEDAAIIAKIAQTLGVPLGTVQAAPSDQNQSSAEPDWDVQIILGQNYNPCQR